MISFIFVTMAEVPVPESGVLAPDVKFYRGAKLRVNSSHVAGYFKTSQGWTHLQLMGSAFRCCESPEALDAALSDHPCYGRFRETKEID